MKVAGLFLKLKAHGRAGFSSVRRLATTGYARLVRLARNEPRAVPAPLAPAAAELQQIIREAQARAEATVLRTAERLDTQFGASSQGLVKGFHETHHEVLVWRRARGAGAVRYGREEKLP